ncbi:hypothetical protein EHJ37_19640 [Vibrio parahaemolyticus]|nr:hypothetical protein [Vibrio parahaemolyticus]
MNITKPISDFINKINLADIYLKLILWTTLFVLVTPFLVYTFKIFDQYLFNASLGYFEKGVVLGVYLIFSAIYLSAIFLIIKLYKYLKEKLIKLINRSMSKAKAEIRSKIADLKARKSKG